MDTRDVFAAHAMSIAHQARSKHAGWPLTKEDERTLARCAFDLADAMMAERNRRRSQRQKPCSPS